MSYLLFPVYLLEVGVPLAGEGHHDGRGPERDLNRPPALSAGNKRKKSRNFFQKRQQRHINNLAA